MAIHRLRIVGVHYAVNPESTSREAETEQMHQRTAERLRRLDEQRPRVVLMPEPSNPVDSYAVMARVSGQRIGYVDKTQLDLVHALLKAQGGRPLLAQIDEVEARKHGWMYVCIQVADELAVEPQNRPQTDWSEWRCDLPVLAPDDAQFACMEAEAVLAEVMENIGEAEIDLIEEYLRLWLKNSLHDLSVEARFTREHYISTLRQMLGKWPENACLSSRLKILIFQLEKLRTAICGNKRMQIRIEVWWKQLLESPQMQLLWDSWLAKHGGDPEATLNETFTVLQTLPADLSGVLNNKALFFSRLYYNHVPRSVFWQIVSAMLLRERALMEKDVLKRVTLADDILSKLVISPNTTTLKQGTGFQTGAEEVTGRYPPAEDDGMKRTVISVPERTKRSVSSATDEEEMEAEVKFEVVIPQALTTPFAQKILAKLQKKGYLDEDFQPKNITMTQAAIMAWEIGDRLRLKNVWVLVGELWKVNGETLRTYRSKGCNYKPNQNFVKEIKALIYSVPDR